MRLATTRTWLRLLCAFSCLLSALLATLAVVPSAHATDADFDAMWWDGRAELNGYRLTVSRYGEERRGTAVLVYVTEPFSESKRVKVDDPESNAEDVVQVLKLNLIRDFQTGIYDYNTMLSVFSRTDAFAPMKISFSSQEWCGQVYEELLFGKGSVHGFYASYFEGESGPREVVAMPNGVAEDNLFILLRGLRHDYLQPGEMVVVQLLPSAFHDRLLHRPLAWVTASIARERETKTITVPAGTFESMVYVVKIGDRAGTYYVENAYPHRLIRWEMLPDVKAELLGSDRLKYWTLHHEGNESYLEKLGLKP